MGTQRARFLYYCDLRYVENVNSFSLFLANLEAFYCFKCLMAE